VHYRFGSRWKPRRGLEPYLWPGKVYSHTETEDEWGVGWKEKRTVYHPLQQGWDCIGTYDVPPDPRDPARFDEARRMIERNTEKYILGYCWFTLFERLWFLRGFNNMLVDPLLYPEHFRDLRDRITEFNLQIIDQWLEMGVDGIFFSDDWGTQNNLLVSPDYWREHYKPCYRQMFDRIHSGGAQIWLHSCGNVQAIIPELIEVGLDVLNPVQPRAMDVEQLGSEFGGRLCFFGGVDVQGTLPYGTPQDVWNEAACLVEHLGRPEGGYIGGTSHSVLPDTPMENIEALFEAFAQCCGHEYRRHAAPGAPPERDASGRHTTSPSKHITKE
jgi:uroporphyrinogen decarboxylase